MHPAAATCGTYEGTQPTTSGTHEGTQPNTFGTYEGTQGTRQGYRGETAADLFPPIKDIGGKQLQTCFPPALLGAGWQVRGAACQATNRRAVRNRFTPPPPAGLPPSAVDADHISA